ncbi:DMT family transporter [Candidatus Woesebacteria bacterium]|nr:DMT family transporter [Candidatus Woesebacteria bacterium]
MRDQQWKKAVLAIITAAIIGGIAPVIAKIALQTFSPLQTVLFRFAGASPFLVFLAWKFGLKWNLEPKSLLLLLGGGVLFACNIVLFIFGIAQTTSVSSQLPYLLTPFVVMLWERIIFSLPIPRTQYVGCALGLVGAAFLILQGSGSLEMGSFTGNLLVTLAAFSWGTYLTYSKHITKNFSPLQLLTTNSVVTTLLVAPLALPSLLGESEFLQTISSSAILSMLFLIVINSIGMFFLYQWALSKVSAVTVSSVFYLNPLVAALFGGLLLGESVTTPILVSAILIGLGSYLSLIYSSKQPSQKSAVK